MNYEITRTIEILTQLHSTALHCVLLAENASIDTLHSLATYLRRCDTLCSDLEKVEEKACETLPFEMHRDRLSFIRSLDNLIDSVKRLDSRIGVETMLTLVKAIAQSAGDCKKQIETQIRESSLDN